MNKNEYNDWVEKTLLLFVADNEVHSGIDREDLAKKYAMAKGIDIPEVDKVPEAWRANGEKRYFLINSYGELDTIKEMNSYTDNARYKFGNYFKSKERAKEVAERLHLYYRLEQLHDIFCPDYKPCWDDDSKKYYINKDCDEGHFDYEERTWFDQLTVAFPTSEIAKKVCDILNEEFA